MFCGEISNVTWAKFSHRGECIEVDSTEGAKYAKALGHWDLRELTFKVVVKDRNALNAEIQEAKTSIERLREDLKYIEA